MAFVLDASVTMAWCFDNEGNPYTESVLEALRNAEAVVPAIWGPEVANVLLVGERRQRLTAAQTMRFLQILRALPITPDDESWKNTLGPALEISRQQGLSAYDASYLELAARRGLPLATKDERLGAAATRIGVPLF